MNQEMRRITSVDLPATTDPRDVLREMLGEKGLAERDLLQYGIGAGEFHGLMGSPPRIDEETSRNLGRLLGQSERFWFDLIQNHRAAVAAGKPALSEAAAKRSRGGSIALRLPSSLHSRLIELAGQEGVSLNQLLVSIVAEGVGRAEQRIGR